MSLTQVRKASKLFYTALNSMANGDAGPLADAWSHGDSVTSMHPIGGRETGWSAVQAVFAQVAQVASEGKIRLKAQQLQVAGEMAVETGIEQGKVKIGGHPVKVDHRVTNVYRCVDGAWKIVHHHTDVSPALLDALARLPPPAKKRRK